MAVKKIYYNEESSDETELQMYQNDKDELYINLTDSNSQEMMCVVLTKEDAINLISDLAFQFELVDDDPEYPRMMWNGNSR